MKRIKYTFLSFDKNAEDGGVKQFIDKDFLFSEEILEAVKAEAYNGEYEIYDDGQPEPELKQTPEERITELEEALALLLSGVTE